MISKADKQWLDDLIPDHWLGSNGQQKKLEDMHPDYRINCINKLNRIKETLTKSAITNQDHDLAIDNYKLIIDNKLKEFSELAVSEVSKNE